MIFRENRRPIQSPPAPVHVRRSCELDDSQLIVECRMETYRASGPGGQKRNKTSSAVRLTHLPSGIVATAVESRSQHENRAKALQRLRLTIALELREDWVALPDWWPEVVNSQGRPVISQRSPRFPPAMAIVLDALDAAQGSLRDSAQMLATSTGQLADLLVSHPHVWAKAQHIRQAHGQKPLGNPNK